MKYWIVWDATKVPPKVCPFCGAKRKYLHQYKKWYSVFYRCDTHLTNDELTWWNDHNGWKSPECETNERRKKWIDNALADVRT